MYTFLSTIVPSSRISIILFATVFTNSWSCDANITLPLNAFKPLFTAVIDSRSRWFVGWSSISMFDPYNIILESIHLTFSPPESTFTCLNTSSPETTFFPKILLYTIRFEFQSLPHCNCLSQSTRFSSQPSKYLELSLGK